MRSTNLVIRKVAESLGLVLVARHVNRQNLVLARLQIAITIGLTVRIGHIRYGLGVKKVRSMNLVLRKVVDSLGLILVARHLNRPNLVLANLQPAIMFALSFRIGHIIYGFGVLVDLRI